MNALNYQWFVYFIVWTVIITVFVFFSDSTVSYRENMAGKDMQEYSKLRTSSLKGLLVVYKLSKVPHLWPQDISQLLAPEPAGQSSQGLLSTV